MYDCKHTWKKHTDVDQRFYCTKCGEMIYPFELIERYEVALNRLAKIGNDNATFGNSIGNSIAQQALGGRID
jgi:hypothetical protein